MRCTVLVAVLVSLWVPHSQAEPGLFVSDPQPPSSILSIFRKYFQEKFSVRKQEEQDNNLETENYDVRETDSYDDTETENFDVTETETSDNLETDGSLSCLDENGDPVDWWILYKLPRKSKKQIAENTIKDKILDEGTGYAFILSSHTTQTWTLSNLSIDDPSSIPGRTLSPLYSSDEDLFHIMFNDEHPHGPTSFNLGHTKGVAFGDESSLVWLIHSVPHYPPYPNETYSYPSTGQKFGQTFMCSSLSTPASLDILGRQFSYTSPYIYSTSLPAWLDRYQSMKEAAMGNTVKVAPYYNTETLVTSAGVQLTSFAKFSLFGKDLYADLVAPSLKIPLLVETWPNGPGKMNSSCSSPFIVENIEEMDFPGIDNEDFTTKHDHAKWAISLDKKKPFVCVGDINRMMTQTKRGGGTACFKNSDVWKSFKSAIKTIEPCPRH